MKLTSKIFDLMNDDDLPPEMQDRLKDKKLSRDGKRILSLFDIKKQLTAAEVMVGLYRAYKVSKTTGSISTALHKLAKCGLIKRAGHGVYEKVEKKSEEPSNG